MRHTKTKLLPGRPHLAAIGILLLFLIAAGLLLSNSFKSNQSTAPMSALIDFDGEYRIGDGPWQTVVKGQHIPADRGDVTLRGYFHMYAPTGEYICPLPAEVPVAFFSNHLSITVTEEGLAPVTTDPENTIFGASACGQVWSAYSFEKDGTTPVEILLHNPHRFGNQTAVDDFIDSIAFWNDLSFEKEVLASGQLQRDFGLLIVITSLILLGTALFSTLLHIQNSKLIWFFGFATTFAGFYVEYSAPGVFFWNNSVTLNTSILCLSMMFYMLFVCIIITSFLKTTKKAGEAVSVAMALVCGILLFLPIVTELYLFDLMLLWVLLQAVANLVLTVCLIREFCLSTARLRYVYLCAGLPLLAFAADALLIALGIWKSCFVSILAFTGILIAALIIILRIIPASVTAAAKAKELEAQKQALDAELAKSRISTMMSQIRPHFIYNTLGSIEQLCELDPPKAGKLVHNFAKYLRGNFDELDNPKPIHMSQEMEHVRHYVSIENVRFPDMTFTFVMNSGDFLLPALTIQPIVENAIKHGLMKLEQGGSIRVCSWETATHYCVSVEDDGVGFDTSILQDDRKHVGLRNIRGRLDAMVGGTLNIESTVGKGTKALIRIPKELPE